MSLPFSILLEQLAAFDPSAQNVDPDLRLATVQDFPGWDRPLRDDILYLTPEASRLPATVKTAIPPAKPLCFAIPAELAGDLPLDRADCRLLLLPETASYADACVQLRSLFARQDAWEQMLTGALNRDASLQEILDVCAFDPSLTVLIWDTSLRLRALSPSVSPSPAGRFEISGRLRGASLRVCLEHVLCSKPLRPVTVTAPDVADHVLLAPIGLEGEPLLFAAMLSDSGQISALDHDRFLLLARELEEHAASGRLPVPEAADALPEGQALPLSERAASCLRPASQGEDSHFHLFVIAFETFLPLRARMLLDSLRLFLPSDPVISLDEQICILHASEFGHNAELETRFGNLLAGQNAYCGISKRLYLPRECRTAYEQARIALQMGMADRHPRQPESRCFLYGDYAEMHSMAMYALKMGSLLSLLPARLESFYRDSLRDGSGMILLNRFLDTGMSPSATAKALGIHRNTVVYRLNRLRDDYGIDLGNTDCLHDVTRMLMIARYYRHYGESNPLSETES